MIMIITCVIYRARDTLVIELSKNFIYWAVSFVYFSRYFKLIQIYIL